MKITIVALSIALFIFLAAIAIASGNQYNHESGSCDKTCGAECAQNSDCSCPSDGCVGQDYYAYSPSCEGDCICQCNPAISYNDDRCMTCDPCNPDCSNPACHGNQECLSCDPNNVDCSVQDCATFSQCLPCDTNNVDCSIPACSSNPKCSSCDSNNVDCNNPSCSSNPKCAPCDASNVNCDVLACANMTQCLPCDVNHVDCSIPACSSNSACTPSQPPSGGGGGYIPPIIGPITTPVVCGDNICSYNETCFNCPKDCLKQGNVCCGSISYFGNCCTDSDCRFGYECNISKECQPVARACNESWVCGGWSDCKGIAQTRVCIDVNDCGSIRERPDIVQRCSAPGPTGMFLQNLSLLAVLGAGGVLFLVMYLWRRHIKGAAASAVVS